MEAILTIDEDNFFVIDFIIKNNTTKAILFIDKMLSDMIISAINGELTIFIDGTFATVPQITNINCQLWTIVIRHDNRVSKIINLLFK